MVNPNDLQRVVSEASAGRMGDSKDLEARAEQARRTFSATMYALESNCPCEACQLLREAMQILRVKPKGQEAQHGADLAPQTPTSSPLP